MLVVLKFSTKKKNTLITTVIVIGFELFSILSRRLFDLRSFNLKWYFNFYKISTQQHQRHHSSILVLHWFFLFLQLFIGSYKEELKCKTNKQNFTINQDRWSLEACCIPTKRLTAWVPRHGMHSNAETLRCWALPSLRTVVVVVCVVVVIIAVVVGSEPSRLRDRWQRLLRSLTGGGESVS